MSTRSNRQNQTDASPQAEGDAPTISPSGDEPASVVAPSSEPPAALTTLVQGQADILALLRETSEQQRRITALLEAAFFPREDQPRPESSQHYQGATAAQVPPPTVAPVYVEAAPREPEIRLQAPEWDGSQDKLEDFLDQCELNFEANPSKFPTDARRIMFAIGNMTGKPRTRIRNVRQQEGEDPPWMSSWRAFCADLRRVHGDPDPSYTARLQLNALRQKGSVSEHAAEFMSLTAKSHLTDQQQALMLFEQSLRPRLREKLTHVPMTDIRDFINAAIVTQRRMQVIQEATTRPAESQLRHRPPLPAVTAKREPPEGPRKMEQPPLPAKDPTRDAAERLRQHRRTNGQCFGCGGSDHLARDCPKAPQTQTLRAHAISFDNDSGTILVNPMDDGVDGFLRSEPIDNLSQLRVLAAAFWAAHRTNTPVVEQEGPVLRIHRHPTLPTYECLVSVGDMQGLALLDTGATASFITPEMVATANIPTHSLRKSVHATFLQGMSAAISRHAAVDIIINNHCITSRHRLFITPMTSHDVLLGMDWIEAARPEPNYTLRTWDLRVPHTVTVPSNPKIEKNELHNLVGRRQLVSTEEDLLVLPEPEEELLPLRASATDLAVLPPEYREYADVFDAKRADQLPPHRPHDHEINLEAGKTPPYGALYSLSHREQEELRNYLRKMQAIGFIRPSSSQAAAPLLFVPKKDGRLRPCVDYRALNAITVKDCYPIPLISEHLDRLATAKIFTKFDLKGAYNLLRIAPGHKWKTAFRTRYGSYKYLVMPFGLCNAPATFQRLMNHMLSDLLDVSVIVYLDDILVFSNNEADHHHHVCQVLDRLRKHQLYCAPDKCEFHTDSVKFLGYLVSPDGLSMDPTKVSTVLEWPPPQSIRQIQVFLGFANFYRRFIRHYSRVAAPLTDLLKGGASGKVDLPPEATAAFNRLKEAFTSAPILRHFSPTLYTVVETDASDAVVAAVLSQWHPQPGADASAEPNSRSHTLHPVAYWSQKMIPAERNYKIHDKELLAIVDACGAWRHYLHGLTRPFLIYTDHQALQYFQTKRQLNRRQARWQADLAEFDFVLHYRPGKEAVRPNALSRRHNLFPDGPSRPDPANQATLLPVNLFARAAGVHSSDPLPTEWIETLRKAANLPPNVAVRDGVPYTTEGHVYLPPQLRDKALHLLHDHPTAGHPGRKTTLHLMRQRFYWPTMVQDTDSYVASCAACRRAKHPRHKPHGYLLPSVPPDRPWSTITMDHITDLLPSLANGTTYNSILVVVDRLTKFVVFIPANKTDTAETLAYQLHRYVFSYFGLPDTIVSDRGTTFVASVWTELLRALRIKGSYSSAYHPQTNGQTERANQTLELFLRFYTAYDHSDWATLLPTAQLALNQRPSATTTIAPAIACFTFAPRAHPSIPPATSNVPSADKVRVCQDAIAKANLAVAKWFNRRRSDVSFRRGDLVLLRTKHLRSDRPSHKLSNPLAGPFKVDKVISNRAYRLLLPPSWKVHPVFHVQMLEPYPDGVRESSDAPQPTTLEDDYADFEVEGVLDSRRRAGRLQYKVSWVGYPPSWVPAEDVDRAPDLVAAYHAANPTKPAPTRR
ncbi:uncharacterized protein MEPE_02716 [Melanopsichium pennsylvanicum]|uniref:RNA-directed DNA polymerase n=1 Tax=Melanopsichium pennsylvanicum TaxID=63383 RepID=A0AAJ4XN11_9BASI|nr:uncharacterized protein MEPE_02716 [Melanopsichium pennsylvanicum]